MGLSTHKFTPVRIEPIVCSERDIGFVGAFSVESIEIPIALNALVADELLECEAAVVVGLAGPSTCRAALDAWIDNDVVSAYLVVSFVIFASSED